VVDPVLDPNTGLIYMRARYYDPQTGQFVTQDPLHAITEEPYAYTADDPVNGTDPSGLCNKDPFTGSFWTSGNCLSGAEGGPNGGGSQPALWDIPAWGATVGACVIPGADALCAGSMGASGAAQSGRGGSDGSSDCTVVGALPPNWQPPTNAPQLPPPPENVPAGWRVRSMPPREGYPDGYWRLEKPMPQGGWQGIDPSTGKSGTQPETHVPFPEDNPFPGEG